VFKRVWLIEADFVKRMRPTSYPEKHTNNERINLHFVILHNKIPNLYDDVMLHQSIVGYLIGS